MPDDYARIQGAIDNATARDTIYVSDGLYHENVVVNKQLNLIGIGLPTVDAGGNNSAIEVTADVCLIESFNVTGSGVHHEDAGICVRSDNNIIKITPQTRMVSVASTCMMLQITTSSTTTTSTTQTMLMAMETTFGISQRLWEQTSLADHILVVIIGAIMPARIWMVMDLAIRCFRTIFLEI